MGTASRTSDYHKRLQLPHQRSPPIQGNDIYAEVICVSKSIRFVYCPSVCVMICSSNVQLVISHLPTLSTLLSSNLQRARIVACCTHLDRVVQPISTINTSRSQSSGTSPHNSIQTASSTIIPSERGRGIIIIINNTKQQIEGWEIQRLYYVHHNVNNHSSAVGVVRRSLSNSQSSGSLVVEVKYQCICGWRIGNASMNKQVWQSNVNNTATKEYEPIT